MGEAIISEEEEGAKGLGIVSDKDIYKNTTLMHNLGVSDYYINNVANNLARFSRALNVMVLRRD